MALKDNYTKVFLVKITRALGKNGTFVLFVLIISMCAATAWSWSLHKKVSVLASEVSQTELLWRQGLKEAPLRENPIPDLLRRFPARSEINQVYFRLQNLASAHRVTLEDTEYGYSAAEAPFSGRVRVRIRTASRYDDVRKFLRAVHEALPLLTLNKVSFERQRIADIQLETILEFVIYYREAQ